MLRVMVWWVVMKVILCCWSGELVLMKGVL